MWSFRSTLFGRRSPRTRKAIAQRAKALLARRGWQVRSLVGPLSHRADFIAARDSTEIAVRCSGEDSRLFGSQVIDMREECLRRGLHPVYIVGEPVEPRLVEQIYIGSSEVLLGIDELDQIEDRVGRLRPVVVGAVDWIGLPNILQGWAKLSPASGSATVVAQLRDEVLGSCEASGFPSSSEGHAKYGFRLVMSRGLGKREILGELRLKVLYRGEYIRLLEIWNHAPVVDLGSSQ